MDDEMEFVNVFKFYKGKTGGINTALDDVTTTFCSGKIYGIVGESGSGKSTMGRIAVGLIYANKGKVLLRGKDIGKMKDEEKFKEAQYIHQDPYSSLDPYLRVYEILERPLIYLLNIKDKGQRREMVQDMLSNAGLGSEYYDKTVQELSGGERQRVLVARAFITNPSFIVADEPTTMIDFVHRKEIMNIISGLGQQKHSTIMLISHDISAVEGISTDILVMFKGKIVERGDTKTIINSPLHPYTRLLLEVSPEMVVKRGKGFTNSEYAVPPSLRLVSTVKKGCNYKDQCPFVMQRCREEEPLLKNVGSQEVACFKYF